MADDVMTGEPMDTKPGDDEAVAPDADLTILQASRAYYDEAKQAKRTRTIKNRRNRDAYMSEGDYSHKTKGQSREFLPKTAMAIEQFSAFFKKALVGYGAWFQAEGPPGDLLAPHTIRQIIQTYLEDCGPQDEPFATIVSDGVKTGALESLMILKVHGRLKTETQYHVERGLQGVESGDQLIPRVTESLGTRDVTSWKLLIDLIPPKDYFPDPTGRGLYEIHEVERDFSDVLAWAEAGIYDTAAVERIDADFVRQEDEAEQARLKGQDQATAPGFRRRVVIQEFYGTILDADGRAVHTKALWAIANDKYVIRRPTPLAKVFWHGDSPIEAIPLIRVPGSTHHKALADNMTALNTAMNELYNLMMDGGLAAVWGTRQIRVDWLEDPRQVSDGIAQGMTLQVNANCPPGEKVMETVTTGQVPQEAMAMFAQTDREFQNASLANELALGQLPSKQVKATEVVAAETSRAVTIDGLVRDVEKGLERVIRKVWLTLLQHADDLATEDVVAAIGPRAALMLARMSPAERFAKYASPAKFKVFGLSAVLARAQDFQKKAALLGLISSNPLMLQAFLKRYSLDKTLDSVLKDLNISPDSLMADELELSQRPEMMEQMPMFHQLTGVKRTGGDGVPGMANDLNGSAGASVNQLATNPLAEMGV